MPGIGRLASDLGIGKRRGSYSHPGADGLTA
jgi:hypothetical protein